MNVVVVGSGDAFGSGGRFQTCIAVRADDAEASGWLLVDCGATSLTALRQQGIDPNEVGIVVVSHLHGDHFGGLPFLIIDGQFRRRTRTLTVVAPGGTAERLACAMETLFPGSSTVQRRFQVTVIEHTDSVPVVVGPFRVTPYLVLHPSGAPAYALRVEHEGSSLAYSGDTEWTGALIAAAEGTDLFLCEAYSPTPVRWHLDLESLKAHRQQLRCQRLILTHLSPTALALDLSEWEVAVDGLTIQL